MIFDTAHQKGRWPAIPIPKLVTLLIIDWVGLWFNGWAWGSTSRISRDLQYSVLGKGPHFPVG